MINEFKGKYFFLSNFYMADVTYNGVTYTNNEAAFQAQKVTDISKCAEFSGLDPSQAKRKGRHVKLREDWEDVKEDIMYEICKSKFASNPDLGKKLLDTGDEYLEEGNTWGDRIWGTVKGQGQNKLGKILMRVRDELSIV